jgi:GT2 family glycosyltransferase
MTRLAAIASSPEDVADAGALLVSGAVVATAFAGAGGLARVVLALTFVTVVPGWALLGRTRLDAVAKLALAVGTSLAVATLCATAMAWLQLWDPVSLVLILAGVSAVLIGAGWVRRRFAVAAATWTAAEPVWVGEVELSRPLHDLELTGDDRSTYRAARLLVRCHGDPVGFVTQPVTEGTLEAAPLRRAIGLELGAAVATITHAPRPQSRALISVVVCTRDRADSLADTLEALLRLDHPRFEVIVVDNAPATEETAELVRTRFAGDRRLRYIREPRPGLSRARNRGVAEARGEIVAFTDDDVVVDAGWLRGVDAGFGRDPRVGCVTGLVPPAELRTEAQLCFDQRVKWGSNLRPRLFDLEEHRAPDALYPYAAGLFGAGANFAFERAFLREIGGFDEALGAGSRARGGEDLDAFVRALRAGRALAYEPSAIAWHVHRDEIGRLRRQMFDYGLALAAFVTKYLTDRATAGDILSRVPAGLWQVARLWPAPARGSRPRRALPLVELLGMVAGPCAYFLGRRDLRRQGP